MYMHENGTICPSRVFLFVAKLDVFPWNVVVLERREGHFGGRQMAIWFQNPKQPKCLQNKGKRNKTKIGLIKGMASNWTKLTLKQAQQTPKGQMAPFSATGEGHAPNFLDTLTQRQTGRVERGCQRVGE